MDLTSKHVNKLILVRRTNELVGLFFIDMIKSIGLGIVIGAPLISLLITIIKWGGPLFYLYTW